ncbi:MAG: PAS domain-containing protein [Anaerolineales bacterium]|nr:PAS domain-containing protein [Anaerolineales bacterium]MCZ2120890.1 PAS domain-containing protein [Anaerolineales bacterium]
MNQIVKFWERINAFAGKDSDTVRKGRLLNVMLTGIFFLGFVVLLLAAVTGIATPNLSSVIGTLIIVSLVLGYINQFSVRSASILLLFFLTLILVFADAPAELAGGRSSFVFFIPIAISSLLLAPAASFLFAVIATVIIIYLSASANIPISPTIPSGYFFLALISWLASRSLEQALTDLRGINANLDRLVADRTQALSESLEREHIIAGRNQAILNSIADGVIVFGADNQAILANPALGRLLERPLNDLIGNKLETLMHTEQLSPASRETMAQLIQSSEQASSGLRIEWGKKTISTSIAPVMDGINNNIGTVAVFRDITREAEVEKLKDSFVAIISHELRTPLNAILGHAEMLKEAIYGAMNDQQASVAGRIMANSGRLLNMVNDLLDEAQISAGKLSIRPEPFKTAALIEGLHQTLDKVAADKGITITEELASDMPEEIIGDAQRLQQIVINLVNNAIKFTEKGGVHVRIFRPQPDQWTIEVRDTGIGIPKEELANIFEAFRQVDAVTTRQRGGFGLGLSIVKQLVELMRGEIKVQSTIGSGSTFSVTLPLETH